MPRWATVLALVLTLPGPPPAMAAPGIESAPTRLTVATRHVPPFAIRRPDGGWEGLSIELWELVAERLNLKFEYREMGLQEMLDRVAGGQADAAAAALTITSERERKMDFSHPFLSSGLGIAVPRSTGNGWLAVGQRLISGRFLGLMGGLIGLLLLVGVLVWALERRRNDQFGGSDAEGIGSGFWWSAVTMTTVGYGDKTPRTLGGRVLAVIWMFTSVILISSFTAGITTALTVSELSGKVQGPNDLAGAHSLTIAGSTSEAYLTEHRYGYQIVTDLSQGLQLLADGAADALVYDAPILRYLVLQRGDATLAVLPGSFSPQDYGIAFPSRSPLREPVNQEILRMLREPRWQDILFRYLGRR